MVPADSKWAHFTFSRPRHCTTSLISSYEKGMRFYLEPFGPGDNILRRVNLYSATGEEDVLLGRNELTGLSNTTFPNFQYVSRRHVLVKHRGDRVFIHPQASQEGVVFLNGQQCNNVEVELKVNDWFSMLGVKHFYNYKLRVDTADTAKASMHAAPAPPVVLNMLDQSMDTVGHDFDQPLSLQSSNSSGTGSNSSSQLNKLTSSQSSSLPPPALRTQSFGSHKSSSQGMNECDTSLEIIELDTSSAEIIVPPITAPVEVPTAAEPAPTVPAVPAVPVAPAVDPAEMERSIMKGIVSKMLRQYECSICYETLACAVSLHPCGCCFCYTCIADWSTENKKPNSSGEVQCPLCQAPFQLNNALANRMVDSAVREVLQNIPSELTAWEKRVQEGSERRKQVEATLGAHRSSSSSSLTSMAAGPTSAASAAAQPFGGNTRININNRSDRASGFSRNEVVELLDSQPDSFAAAFPPPRSSAAAAPSRPTNIMSFFGRPNAAAASAASAVPTAAAPAVNIISGVGVSQRDPSRGRQFGSIAGHRHIDEHSEAAYETYINERNDRRARKRGRLLVAAEAEAQAAAELAYQRQIGRLAQDMNHGANNSSSSNANNGATVGVTTTSSSTGTSTTTAATAASNSSNAVFDLTAASSPARRRQQAAAAPPAPALPARAAFSNSAASVLARAVAAQPASVPAPATAPAAVATPATAAARAQATSTVPIVPDPSDPYGDDEYFCVMPVSDLPQATTCTNCTRSFRTLTSAVGIFPKRNGNGRKPVSKTAWLLMCNDWRCPLCIANFNQRRRSTQGQGKLVSYQALELVENLSHSDKMTWYNLLRV